VNINAEKDKKLKARKLIGPTFEKHIASLSRISHKKVTLKTT
jgi:hypothetical protein